MQRILPALFVLIGAATPLFSQAGGPMRLTLQEAEMMALKNHPQVLAEQNVISQANQRVIETRSAYYPLVDGDATTSEGNVGARIGAGYLTASRLFNRVGLGFTINQLVTDFGRTPNLVAESKLRANATQQDYMATQYDVLVAVDRAYFGTLRAQALVKVAQETVAARQLVLDQVTALANNNLRSQLDVSFAGVNLADAKLLLIQSQNGVQAAYADVTRALGQDQAPTTGYDLADQPLPPGPPETPEPMVEQAIQNRPELASLRLNLQAANRFEEAEKDLSRPNVNLLGVTGYMPYVDQITLPRAIPNEYAGGGVNIQIPIFNGHLFAARREEAHYRALETDQRLRDRMEQIQRDVRAAWATAVTAYQNLDVTAQMLREATMALSLAQGRYDNNLATIVELTQGQLYVTQAEIANVNAKYDYQTQYANLQYTIGALR